jgi:hypothetical protein
LSEDETANKKLENKGVMSRYRTDRHFFNSFFRNDRVFWPGRVIFSDEGKNGVK